jgi:hypothetical protein
MCLLICTLTPPMSSIVLILFPSVVSISLSLTSHPNARVFTAQVFDHSQVRSLLPSPWLVGLLARHNTPLSSAIQLQHGCMTPVAHDSLRIPDPYLHSLTLSLSAPPFPSFLDLVSSCLSHFPPPSPNSRTRRIAHTLELPSTNCVGGYGHYVSTVVAT